VTTESQGNVVGSTVFSEGGDKIGEVSQVYGVTGQVTWAAVKIGRARGRHLVPLNDAMKLTEGLVVPYAHELVTKSPTLQPRVLTELEQGDLGITVAEFTDVGTGAARMKEISRAVTQVLAELYEHYGLGPAEGDRSRGPNAATAGPLPGPPAGSGDRPEPLGARDPVLPNPAKPPNPPKPQKARKSHKSRNR
jgi:hypothetical protein